MSNLGTPFIVVYKQLNAFLAAELAGVDLTATELLYLALLYERDGRTQEEFCRAYCVDRAAAARTVQHMEAKGLVTRAQDEADRRAKRVWLTEAARAWEPALRAAQSRWAEAVTEGLAPEEVAVFEQVLARMAHNARALNKGGRA